MRRPSRRRQLEARKREARRDCASGQRPVAEARRGLPGVGGDNGLRAFAGGEIGAEADALDRRAGVERNLELERGAGIMVPGLGGVDAMPMGALAARQQEIDGGRGGAPGAVRLVAKGLAKMAAFGMG